MSTVSILTPRNLKLSSIKQLIDICVSVLFGQVDCHDSFNFSLLAFWFFSPWLLYLSAHFAKWDIMSFNSSLEPWIPAKIAYSSQNASVRLISSFFWYCSFRLSTIPADGNLQPCSTNGLEQCFSWTDCFLRGIKFLYQEAMEWNSGILNSNSLIYNFKGWFPELTLLISSLKWDNIIIRIVDNIVCDFAVQNGTYMVFTVSVCQLSE